MGLHNSKSSVLEESIDPSASDAEKLKKACESLDEGARQALLVALHASAPSPNASVSLVDLLRFVDSQDLMLKGPKQAMDFLGVDISNVENGEDLLSEKGMSPLVRTFPSLDATEEEKDEAIRSMAEFTEWWAQVKKLPNKMREFNLPFPGYLPPFKHLGGTPFDVTDFVTTRYHAWRVAGWNRGNPYANGLLGLPRFHDAFDWWLTNRLEQSCAGKGFVKDVDPRFILVSLVANDGATVENLIKLLESRADASHRKRTIVFGGGDRRLSDQDQKPLCTIAEKWADRILWEAKDVELSLSGPDGAEPLRVETMPIGLTENYYRRIAPQVNNAINSASLDTKTRKPCVLAAWGASASHGGGVDRNESLDTRELADRAATKRPDLIERRRIPWQEYWTELKTYRFILYPQGDGVQSPKYAEALLTLTIPIALRCPAFEDLKSYGLPIVVVDSFEDEVTEENLEKWWAELSPGLHKARERMLVHNYFKEFVRGA